MPANTNMLYALTAILALVALALLVGAVSRPLERALLYQPSGERVPPGSTGLENVDEIVIDVTDGAQIIAWYTPAPTGGKTVLYFHGNGASLAARAGRIDVFQRMGLGVLMMSYRSYSGSTGTPSETNNVADAARAFDTLTDKGVQPSDIILYGESLGSGVAIQLAAQRPGIRALILDAPYTSIVDVAKLHYPYLPARLLMRDRYDTMAHMPNVHQPILIIHGERDYVVPVEMGRAVAKAAAPSQATLKTFPEASHHNHADHGSIEHVANWIARLD